jgi:putative two-component system response regulator
MAGRTSPLPCQAEPERRILVDLDSNKKPIILTVDDDPIILNLVIEALKDAYTVRPFTSGKAALKYLEHNTANLVLLDHNMPEMTGLEVLDQLQADEQLRGIPVVFLTGSEDGSDEVAALENGAVDYLRKPFRQAALRSRVRLQLELLNHRVHLENLVAQRTEELKTAYDKLASRDKVTLELLAQASDIRDHDTGLHLERTTAFSGILVADLLANPHEGYELTEAEGQDIVEAIKLHDLGKLAMPDAVLLKPGRLTEDEFAIIKTHPTHGYEMLNRAVEQMAADSLLLCAQEITYGHHEKWDGSGYPRGQSGADIPLSARIAAIADVYDALTSVRPYKRAFTHEEAREIIYRDAGSHFDPYLVEILKRHEDEFARIADEKRDAVLAQDHPALS